MINNKLLIKTSAKYWSKELLCIGLYKEDIDQLITYLDLNLNEYSYDKLYKICFQ